MHQSFVTSAKFDCLALDEYYAAEITLVELVTDAGTKKRNSENKTTHFIGEKYFKSSISFRLAHLDPN